MSVEQEVRESVVRRIAYAVLAAAVRGRRERGGDWGEAVLAEFAETTGDREAVRWAAGGLRTVWSERHARRRELPRIVRIRRRAVRIVLIGIVATSPPTATLSISLLSGSPASNGGDVVEFTVPGTKRLVIKRVIGLPGDTVGCRDGRVWLNGASLDEPYLSADLDDARTDHCTATTVPPHQLYVLGDFRVVSEDSRTYGTVNDSALHGRVLRRL